MNRYGGGMPGCTGRIWQGCCVLVFVVLALAVLALFVRAVLP